MSKMFIVHSAKRAGGSIIPMPPSPKNPKGFTYHFKPTKTSGDAHVAEVSDKKHLTMFLQIPTFSIFGDDDDDDDGDEDQMAPEPDQTGASMTNEDTLIGTGESTTGSAIPADVNTGGTVSGDAQNVGGDDGEGGAPHDQNTHMTPAEVAALTDAEIAKVHEKKLGRKPHPAAKRTTLEAAVNAQMAEDAATQE